MSFKEPSESCKLENMESITWNNGLVADRNYSTHCFQNWSYEAYGLGLHMKKLNSSLIKLHHRSDGGVRCVEMMRKPKITLVDLFFVAKNLHPKSLPQSLMLHSQSKNVSKAVWFVRVTRGRGCRHSVRGWWDWRLLALPLVATDMVHNISLFGLPINGLRKCNMLGQAAKLWLIQWPLYTTDSNQNNRSTTENRCPRSGLMLGKQ